MDDAALLFFFQTKTSPRGKGTVALGIDDMSLLESSEIIRTYHELAGATSTILIQKYAATSLSDKIAVLLVYSQISKQTIPQSEYDAPV